MIQFIIGVAIGMAGLKFYQLLKNVLKDELAVRNRAASWPRAK